MASTSQPLTLTEIDETTLDSCNSDDGAIEDADVFDAEVRYR
jgi:hypothetical protein